MTYRFFLGATLATVLTAFNAFAGNTTTPGTSATATSKVTAVSGVVTQLNYDNDGQVAGLLVGTKTLLTFPGRICGGLGTLATVGNNVTYSGTAFTVASGFQTINVTSFTNNTTSATFTAPTSNGTTTYGPTTGTITQLNYFGNGAIDGFNFTPAGGTTSIYIYIGPFTSSTLAALLTVDATVSVTGFTSPSMSACAATSTLEVVNASSLTIGTQTIVIRGSYGPGGGGRH